MSLDNVLAVTEAAKDHPMIMAFGLLLSIALMGLVAWFIANLLTKHRWIAYIGLAIIAFVAVQMIFMGLKMCSLPPLAMHFIWAKYPLVNVLITICTVSDKQITIVNNLTQLP